MLSGTTLEPIPGISTHAATKDGGKMNSSPQVDAMHRPSLANRLFSLIFFFTGSMLGAIFYTVPDLKHRDEGS